MEKNLTDNDSDIESKFFIRMPYDSDDPDFNWHKTFTSTDDDDDVANKKGFDKTPYRGDAQKSRRYRKIPQSTMINKQINYSEMVASPQFRSSTSRFNSLEGTYNNNESGNWITPHKRLNRSFPSETHSLVRSSLKELSPNVFENSPLRLSCSPQSKTEMMPMYRGFQLIGDSQLLRFSEQLCKNSIPATHSGETPRRLGYCVSGQRIREIETRLREKEYPIGKKVILLIGTNDLLKNTLFDYMCQMFKSTVEFLKENTEYIILLTVPPVPKLAGHAEHWIKLKRFNDFILKCAEERKVYVIDSGSLYVTYNNTVSLEYFEETFYNINRPDLIHLNNLGFQLLKSLLDIFLEKNALV